MSHSHCEQAADTAADVKVDVDSSVEIESTEYQQDIIHGRNDDYDEGHDDGRDDDGRDGDDDDDDDVSEQHSAVVVRCRVTDAAC